MIQAYLFDQFRIHYAGTPLSFEARKAQELFAFLLIHMDRPIARELIASRLWGETCTTTKSRAYLRKALWKLQAVLRDVDTGPKSIFVVDGDAVSIDGSRQLWTDIHELKQAYESVRDKPGPDIDRLSMQRIKAAIDLYAGDLLSGWFSDWCIAPRSRLKQMYRVLLDKLLTWAVSAREYETGLEAAHRILVMDRACERAHHQLIRLYACTGRRSDALRQFEVCEAALEEELGVAPTRSTIHLIQDIRSGRIPEAKDRTLPLSPPPTTLLSNTSQNDSSVVVTEESLDRLSDRISGLEDQMQLLIRVLEEA